MRVLLALALTLAACAADVPAEAPTGPAPEAPPPEEASTRADDLAARAAAAGLTLAQAQALAAYGAGAVVPTLPDGWRLASFADESIDEGGFVYPGYVLRYRRGDGACFGLMAASEGLGDVFMIEPPNQDEATAPGIATFGPIPVGWSAPDAPEGDWGPGRLSTEWFGTDGLSVLLNSAAGDGCTMVTVEEARGLLAGLRYLDPADQASLPGVWAWVDVMGEGGDYASARGADPEAAARAAFAGEARTTRVETIRPGERRRVVLVTHEGLMDDSVRDERVRVAYLRDPDGQWTPQYAGRQQRRQPGRGHADWSPEPCLRRRGGGGGRVSFAPCPPSPTSPRSPRSRGPTRTPCRRTSPRTPFPAPACSSRSGGGPSPASSSSAARGTPRGRSRCSTCSTTRRPSRPSCWR